LVDEADSLILVLLAERVIGVAELLEQSVLGVCQPAACSGLDDAVSHLKLHPEFVVLVPQCGDLGLRVGAGFRLLAPRLKLCDAGLGLLRLDDAGFEFAQVGRRLAPTAP
jgi:hypothetical protein